MTAEIDPSTGGLDGSGIRRRGAQPSRAGCRSQLSLHTDKNAQAVVLRSDGSTSLA